MGSFGGFGFRWLRGILGLALNPKPCFLEAAAGITGRCCTVCSPLWQPYSAYSTCYFRVSGLSVFPSRMARAGDLCLGVSGLGFPTASSFYTWTCLCLVPSSISEPEMNCTSKPKLCVLTQKAQCSTSLAFPLRSIGLSRSLLKTRPFTVEEIPYYRYFTADARDIGLPGKPRNP